MGLLATRFHWSLSEFKAMTAREFNEYLQIHLDISDREQPDT